MTRSTQMLALPMTLVLLLWGCAPTPTARPQPTPEADNNGPGSPRAEGCSGFYPPKLEEFAEPPPGAISIQGDQWSALSRTKFSVSKESWANEYQIVTFPVEYAWAICAVFSQTPAPHRPALARLEKEVERISGSFVRLRGERKDVTVMALLGRALLEETFEVSSFQGEPFTTRHVLWTFFGAGSPVFCDVPEARKDEATPIFATFLATFVDHRPSRERGRRTLRTEVWNIEGPGSVRGLRFVEYTQSTLPDVRNSSIFHRTIDLAQQNEEEVGAGPVTSAAYVERIVSSDVEGASWFVYGTDGLRLMSSVLFSRNNGYWFRNDSRWEPEPSLAAALVGEAAVWDTIRRRAVEHRPGSLNVARFLPWVTEDVPIWVNYRLAQDLTHLSARAANYTAEGTLDSSGTVIEWQERAQLWSLDLRRVSCFEPSSDAERVSPAR